MTSTTPDDDDIPQLSSHALSALQEFYQEQSVIEEKCDKITENWQLSQFWYDDRTADLLARETLAAMPSGNTGAICFLSSPTAFKRLKEIGYGSNYVKLLEFDKRFGKKYPEEFQFYDYNTPLDLPKDDFQSKFDIILADPPFLSEECMSKTSETIKYLSKPDGSTRIIVCTGAVMEEKLETLLNCKMIDFRPQHANNLANEFRCYTNYVPCLL